MSHSAIQQDKELKLYSYDARPEPFQTERLAVLQKILSEDGHWSIFDFDKEKINPNLNLTIQLKKKSDPDRDLSPAISYIVEKLRKYNLDDGIQSSIGELLLRIRDEQKLGKILDLSMEMPGGIMIYTSAGENPAITLDYKYTVNQDAGTDQIILLDKLQDLEYNAGLRIKFASLDERGVYVGDSAEEYDSVFDELPEGWHFNHKPFQILARSRGQHNAWRLDYKNIDVLAVEHETGLEILVEIGLGLGISAIYDLTKSALLNWISKRKAISAKGTLKAPTFLEIERSTRDASGNITSTESIKIRGPVGDEIIRQTLERFAK